MLVHADSEQALAQDGVLMPEAREKGPANTYLGVLATRLNSTSTKKY